MKKLILAATLGLALPVIGLATELGPAPIVPYPLTPQKSISTTVSPITFAGPQPPQEQYREVCNGTSHSPDAAILAVLYCTFAQQYSKQLNLSEKQTAIFNNWLIYSFMHKRHLFAALAEGYARRYGRAPEGSVEYRKPLSESELTAEQNLAQSSAYYANKERDSLFKTLSGEQAKKLLLKGGIDYIEPYRDYDRELGCNQ